MELPGILQSAEITLLAALQTPVLGEWPDNAGYTEADQPAAIGRALIEEIHDELQSARIAYLFREELKRRDRIRLGTASKASSKVQFLTDFDFVIEFNWTAWRALTPEQRVALVDHELCHCIIDPDTSKYAVRHHDVEEFGEIVRRWGLWQPDLTSFGKDVAVAIGQGDLFIQQVMEKMGRELAKQEAPV